MSSNEAETPPLLTIACYIPLKKKKKFDLLKLAEACRSRRVKLIPIDLDNGTFAGDVDPVTIDILLHKLTDVLSRKKDGDGNALSIAASLERFVSSNPAMIVLDPIGNVEHLLDRCTQYEMLAARYPLQHVAVTGVSDDIQLTRYFIHGLYKRRNGTFTKREKLKKRLVPRPSRVEDPD